MQMSKVPIISGYVNVEQYKYDYYLNLVFSLWNTWRDNKVILYIVVLELDLLADIFVCIFAHPSAGIDITPLVHRSINSQL